MYETSPSDVEFIFRVYIRPRPLTRRGHAVEDVSSVWKLDDRPVTFSSPAVLLGVLEVKHEWKGESWPSLAVEPCTGSGRSLNTHGSFLKKKRLVNAVKVLWSCGVHSSLAQANPQREKRTCLIAFLGLFGFINNKSLQYHVNARLYFKLGPWSIRYSNMKGN